MATKVATFKQFGVPLKVRRKHLAYLRDGKFNAASNVPLIRAKDICVEQCHDSYRHSAIGWKFVCGIFGDPQDRIFREAYVKFAPGKKAQHWKINEHWQDDANFENGNTDRADLLVLCLKAVLKRLRRIESGSENH